MDWESQFLTVTLSQLSQKLISSSFRELLLYANDGVLV